VSADRAKRSASRGAVGSTPDDPRVVYVPRQDATPEGELTALAAVYAFLFERHQQRATAAEAGDAEDGTGGGPAGASPGEGAAEGSGA
jgi:hypothetical protein